MTAHMWCAQCRQRRRAGGGGGGTGRRGVAARLAAGDNIPVSGRRRRAGAVRSGGPARPRGRSRLHTAELALQLLIDALSSRAASDKGPSKQEQPKLPHLLRSCIPPIANVRIWPQTTRHEIAGIAVGGSAAGVLASPPDGQPGFRRPGRHKLAAAAAADHQSGLRGPLLADQTAATCAYHALFYVILYPTVYPTACLS